MFEAEQTTSGVPMEVVAAAISGLVALAAIVLGVVLRDRNQRALDQRRQRDRLASEATTDMFKALAMSAHGDNNAAKVLFAHAKARLAVYGSVSLARAILAFVDAHSDTSNPAARSALISLVQGARAITWEKERRGPEDLADEEVHKLLFG